jgi:hypothetical protein
MIGTPFFLKFIIVLTMKTKRPASPLGLVLFYYLYRGLHPIGVKLSATSTKSNIEQGITNVE